MAIDQHNYDVPSSQPTSHEPSPSLPSPSMQMLPSTSSSPISNLPENCGKQNHKTSNLKRNRFIASKKKDFREKINALAVLCSLKRKKQNGQVCTECSVTFDTPTDTERQ